MRSAIAAALLLGCISVTAFSQTVSPSDTQTTDPSNGIAGAHQPPAPNGRITGHVLCDDTHRPARGALVMAEPLPSADGSVHGGGGMNMMTHVGTDGTYTLGHLRPGDYTVFAFTPGYLSNVQDVMAAEVTGNLKPAQQREILARNGTVSLRGDDTASFDITLHRGAAISGRVLFSDGAPASQVTLVLEDVNAKPAKDAKTSQEQEFVTAMARGMLTHQNFETDDRGQFRLVGIQPGTYRLAVTQPTANSGEVIGDDDGMEAIPMVITGIADPHALRFYAGDTPHRASAKTFDLRAGDEITGVDITVPLDTLHQLHGTVTARDGRTINMGQITLTDNTDPTLVFHANLHRDGTFTVQQVPPGNYTLAVSNAHIGKPLNPNADITAAFVPLQPTDAFADGNLTVLVKDDDISDLSLTLDEIPLPKNNTTATSPGNDQ